MLAKSESLEAEDQDASSAAEARVSGFLAGLEAGEALARRRRVATFVAGAALAAVGFLTSIGVVPTEAQGLVAGAVAISGFVAATSGGPVR